MQDTHPQQQQDRVLSPMWWKLSVFGPVIHRQGRVTDLMSEILMLCLEAGCALRSHEIIALPKVSEVYVTDVWLVSDEIHKSEEWKADFRSVMIKCRAASMIWWNGVLWKSSNSFVLWVSSISQVTKQLFTSQVGICLTHHYVRQLYGSECKLELKNYATTSVNSNMNLKAHLILSYRTWRWIEQSQTCYRNTAGSRAAFIVIWQDFGLSCSVHWSFLNNFMSDTISRENLTATSYLDIFLCFSFYISCWISLVWGYYLQNRLWLELKVEQIEDTARRRVGSQNLMLSQQLFSLH